MPKTTTKDPLAGLFGLMPKKWASGKGNSKKVAKPAKKEKK